MQRKTKKFNKNNLKFIIIMTILVVSVGLIIYGTIYAFKHQSDSVVLTTGDLKVKFTGDASQVDSLTLPKNNGEVTLSTLPKTSGTLTEINYATFKTLFQTSKKSILILEKTGCSFCEEFEPIFIQALETYQVTAYKINITNLTNNELADLYNYLDFNGTPTTYIIDNGVATHSYSGTTDADTIGAFIDYFYLRAN